MKLVLCIGLAAAVAACSAPMDRVEKLSDVELAEGADSAAALPGPDAEEQARKATRGLFAGLFGRRDPAPEAETSEDATGAPETAMIDPQQSGTAQDDGAERSSGGGLFGGTSRATAATGPVRRSGAPDGMDVPPGTVLPYGQIARVCGLSTRDMGRRIEAGSGYSIYDSAPGNTAPHTFYVTGFGDGCARQFTAALAVLGSAGMHEQLRYGLPSEVQPYSSTDKAYEQVKAQVCRVGRQKPCGSRIGRLERDTVFVSFYERFGSNARWADMLLHDGEVVAKDLKNG